MNRCGYWAHCALHCDLTCDHNQWCPGYPPESAAATAQRGRLSALLRRLANRLDTA